jgi:signal transduction histidine kinase
MSLKIRFALLFSIVVAIILLLSSVSIYLLYSDHRKNEYTNQLKSEAMLTFDMFVDKLLNEKDTAILLSKEVGDNSMQQKCIKIFNTNKESVYSSSLAASFDFKFESKVFDKIKKQKEYYFLIDNREFLGIYIADAKTYVISSAIDIDGLNKLRKLKFILFAVFIVSVIITTSLSYFFVSSALRPLSKLNTQIQQTSELNLSQKVEGGSGNDEIAQIAKNVNEMLERLNKAFQLQKNFVHHASHELRTPLTTMYASTEAALNKKLSEADYKKVLTSLKEDQNSLIELTNSLLLLYQFDKLKFAPNFHSFRIDELIYDAIGYCKKVFPMVVIDFEFVNIPEESDLIIKANDVLLKSAFNNLIKNAFLYSDDKKLNISLVASETEMQINFDNRGYQLSETEIENIKIPFSRGENIGLVKGIGLGLSIVEKIITLHNGQFIYTPMANSVNRFSVKLK